MLGYNGSKGNNLDITSAPRATTGSPGADPTNLIFNYEQSGAFSRFNAGTLRVNKRLGKGIALGANYQYSHSIDDAGSVGGTSTVVAQNWQDLSAEEGNSSFDQRHRVTGTYLYELPFGKDKFWFTSGVGSHILEGFSISGSFTFATGTPLTPSYQAAVQDVARGTAGTLRPDRDSRRFDHRRGRFAAEVVQHRGLQRRPRTPYGNVFAQLDRRAGNDSEQYVALQDDAAGRHAQHGVSRYGQQCLQHRAVRGRGHQCGFANLRAGDFSRLHARVSIHGEVQVLAAASQPRRAKLVE